MIAFLSNEFKKDLNEQTNGQRYTEVPPSRRRINKKTQKQKRTKREYTIHEHETLRPLCPNFPLQLTL